MSPTGGSPRHAGRERSAAPASTEAPRVVVQGGEQQRFRGRVTSYCPIKGAGIIRCDNIIKCEGVRNMVTQDVILDRAAAEKSESELTNGAVVSFFLELDPHVRLRAYEIRMLLKGARQREFVSNLVGGDLDWNATYVGVIRLLYKEKNIPASLNKRDAGWGYIACKETEKLFGRDVWAYPSQLGGYKIGDIVKFRVSIDHWWSWPIALGIEYVGMVENDDLVRALRDGILSSGKQAPDSRADAPEPKAADAGPTWKQYSNPGGEGYWWWCESDGDWFLEDEPGPWTKYKDPDTGKQYWWKADDKWFWV